VNVAFKTQAGGRVVSILKFPFLRRILCKVFLTRSLASDTFGSPLCTGLAWCTVVEIEGVPKGFGQILFRGYLGLSENIGGPLYPLL
jgi:hypothetical protein